MLAASTGMLIERERKSNDCPQTVNNIHTKSWLGEGLSVYFADFWDRSQWFYFPQKNNAVQSRGDKMFSATRGICVSLRVSACMYETFQIPFWILEIQ